MDAVPGNSNCSGRWAEDAAQVTKRAGLRTSGAEQQQRTLRCGLRMEHKLPCWGERCYGHCRVRHPPGCFKARPDHDCNAVGSAADNRGRAMLLMVGVPFAGFPGSRASFLRASFALPTACCWHDCLVVAADEVVASIIPL